MTMGNIFSSIGIMLFSFGMIEITTTIRYIGYSPISKNDNLDVAQHIQNFIKEFQPIHIKGVVIQSIIEKRN